VTALGDVAHTRCRCWRCWQHSTHIHPTSSGSWGW
jgi:hypothetical protein